jgi:hypothetical protein
MLMNNQKSKLPQLIASRLGEGSGEESYVDNAIAESDTGLGKKLAVEKLISAVHGKDSSAALEALSDFVDLHFGDEAEEDEESGT